MELATTSQQEKNLSTEVKSKEIELGKIVYNINLILSYPLNDFQITDWAKCINRFLPNIKNETLQQIIDLYILGKLEYNNNIGIQNIFKGYVFLINQKLIPLHEFEQRMFYKNDYNSVENAEEKVKECKKEIQRLIELKKPFEKIQSSTVINAIL